MFFLVNFRFSGFWLLGIIVQDDGCSAKGDDGSIGDAYSILASEYVVVEECSAKAVVVSERVDDFASLVAAYVDVAVTSVHARIVRLNGDVDFGSLVAPPDKVVAQLQGKHLTVGKGVFHNRNEAV